MAFICFDLDNTLISADQAHLQSYQHALTTYSKAFRVHTLPARALIRSFGRVGRVILKEFFPHLTEHQLTILVKEHHTYFLHAAYKKARPLPGIKKTLNTLARHHTLALVTNCHTRVMNKLLSVTRINKSLFKVRIGNDQVLHPKPAPDEIHKAEHALHLKADYMVGDTIYDIMAAHKAKVKAISVLTGTTPGMTLKKYKPYAILKSVNVLPRFLNKDLTRDSRDSKQ